MNASINLYSLSGLRGLAKLLAIACCFVATSAHASHTVTRTTKAGQIELSYTLFVPSQPAAQPALFVALHGCFQENTAFADGIRLNEIAEQRGFYVLYPNQSYINNAWKCWNWFIPDNQQRGPGELGWMAEVTKRLIVSKKIDSDKVYVVGLSAGSAMAADLIGCYSEIYHGALLHSGLEFGAAQNEIEAHNVMKTGPSRSTDDAAELAFNCSPHHPHPLKVIIFHGEKDPSVDIINSKRTRDQFIGVNKLILQDAEVSSSASQIKQDQYRYSADVVDYRFSTSNSTATLVKTVFVQQMAHAWSGGSSVCSYMDPLGVDATTIGVNFLMGDN